MSQYVLQIKIQGTQADIIKYLFHFLVLYKSGGKLSDGFPAANKGVLDKEVNLFTKRQKIM